MTCQVKNKSTECTVKTFHHLFILHHFKVSALRKLMTFCVHEISWNQVGILPHGF